jgi:hypothetical protein
MCFAKKIAQNAAKTNCTLSRRNKKFFEIFALASWSNGIISACGREIESRQGIGGGFKNVMKYIDLCFAVQEMNILSVCVFK